MPGRYLRPSWFTTHIWNRLVILATRFGISIYGSRILAVRGRTTGAWRTTPVNVLPHNGERYLLAPRGNTQWVRNLRAAGQAELHVGSRSEPIQVVEIHDEEKPPILRAYLRRWAWETGAFFQNTGPDASSEDLRRIAPGYPVFRIRSG